MAARAFAFGTSLVGMGILLPTTRASCGGFSWRVLRRRGVDVGVAVAVGACVAGGSMEGGLLLLAEPSGVVSGKFSWSLIKTLTLLTRKSVSGVSSDGRINSWP